MTEYIDREKARATVCSLCRWEGTDNCSDCEHPIDDIPSADVRSVVMCKDCGHWNKENQHPSKRSRNSVAMCAWFSRNYGTIETSDGDWCSYGYRREES